MAKHVPAQGFAPLAPARAAVPRVIHYADPAQLAGVQLLTERELAERRAQDRVLYARWVKRQAVIAERDRKARRFWLAFGALSALGLLVTVILVGWLLIQLLASAWAIVVAVLLLACAGGALVSHRCITVIQHWHG